jgi:hypothetical protein
MDIANNLRKGHAIGQPKPAPAIRQFELIDVHNPLIATGHRVQIVQTERIVQVVVADSRCDQRGGPVLEPALPSTIWCHEAHLGSPLESIQGNRRGQRH